MKDILDKLYLLNDSLLVLAEKFCSETPYFFPDRLSKIYYLIEQADLSEQDSNTLIRLSYIKSGKSPISLSDAKLLYEEAILILKGLDNNISSNSDIADSSKKPETDKIEGLPPSNSSERKQYHSFRFTVSDKIYSEGKDKKIILDGYESNKPDEIIKLSISGNWLKIAEIADKGSVLNAINFRKNTDSDTPLYYETRKSYLVYEPDYLVDVSEVASCFDLSKASYSGLLLKRFASEGSSYPLIKGSMVNTIFDELLVDSTLNFDDYYEKALKSCGLSLFAVSHRENLVAKGLHDEIYEHFLTLKKVVEGFSSYDNSTEPTFLSTEFGLQGRLDLLQERRDNSAIKDIYELKSGKKLSGAIVRKTKGGKNNYISVWPAHEAQLAGYDILLSSAFEDRKGSSFLIYSGDAENPIRNALRTVKAKQRFVYMRNLIVYGEIKNALDFESPIKRLKAYRKEVPKYSENVLESIIKSFEVFDRDRLQYLSRFSSHISKEILAGKIGKFSDNSGREFSSLWNDENNSNIISNLEFKSIDTSNGRIEFERDDSGDTSIRKGDSVIIYRKSQESDNLSNAFDGQVLKAIVKSLNIYEIEISLRNKQFNIELFKGRESGWNIALDFFDSTLKKLHSEVFRFTTSDNFQTISGIGIANQDQDQENSSTGVPHIYEFEGHTREQNEIISYALNAENFYFLQGPPGTGKTRYFTSTIVKHLFENTNQRILITSFTNRAVDEAMQSIMLNLGEEHLRNIIRYGGKESSELKEVLFPFILDQIGIKELYKRTRDCRVFGVTISSLISNRELFDMLDFDTVIIDEAGQISEYYLNIIFGRIPKMIFVGDERQLPPFSIVEDYINEDKDEPVDRILSDIIPSINPADPYFTRMVNLLKLQDINVQKQYLGSFTYQGRMTGKIMDAANEIAYEGKLKGISEFIGDNDYPIDAINLFNVKTTVSPINTSIEEAKQVIKIIKSLVDSIGQIDKNSIGVIAPFRVQCNLIREQLKDDWRPYILVDTVERFQGSEREHIILSTCVRDTNSLGKISSGFHALREDGTHLYIDRKLNVALTRAKKTFSLVGNLDVLKKDISYKKLIDFVNNNRAQ